MISGRLHTALEDAHPPSTTDSGVSSPQRTTLDGGSALQLDCDVLGYPFGGWRGQTLPSGNIDTLPAEKEGIDRPGPRSEHGQSNAKGCQQKGTAQIAGSRKGDPQLKDGC